MSSGPSDPAAAEPSPREEEQGSARKRIAYSREFLISVGTSSEACRRLPVGFDASKELGLVDAGSRAPFGRWVDACSWRSTHTESTPNQPDRHSGIQFRHSWQSKEHAGLLGSGAFPRIPHYAGPLESNGQGSGYQLTRRNAGGYQPTRQYEAPTVSHKNVDLINTETSGSFENWNRDRVEEERKRRASFELIRKEQHHALQEKKKAHDSDKENLGDGIISLLHDSAGKRDPPTKCDKQGGLNTSSLSKEDAIKTAPLLPTPTTTPLTPLDFTNGLPQKRLQIQSFNTSPNSEIQLLNTEDTMVSNAPESSISAQRFSDGGILGPGHTDKLSPKQMVPFSHSKCGPFHMRPGTLECDKPTFSGPSQERLEIHLPEEDTQFSVNDFSYAQNTNQGSAGEGANFDVEGLEICLPEEDDLFTVNDFLYTQITDQWSAAEWDRAEGLPAKDDAADINSRFQSLDVSGSHFHDQIDPNNLYHLFETRPDAESPKRNVGAMFVPSRTCDRGRQAQLDMTKAIHHGSYVHPAPGGPCAGPAAPHHILPHTTMPGSFPTPQGFPRCAPLPQRVHHMFDHRTWMMGRCQPGYGEIVMMMEGPGLDVYHAGTFDRPVEMDPRGRSTQMHPSSLVLYSCSRFPWAS